MLDQLIAVILSLAAISVNLMIGNKKRYAWALALLCELLWAVYAVRLHQFGLLLGVPFFSVVYLRNWFKWAA